MGHWNSSCDQKILFILSLDLFVARFVSVKLSFDFRVGAFSFSVALAVVQVLYFLNLVYIHSCPSQARTNQRLTLAAVRAAPAP